MNKIGEDFILQINHGTEKVDLLKGLQLVGVGGGGGGWGGLGPEATVSVSCQMFLSTR